MAKVKVDFGDAVRQITSFSNNGIRVVGAELEKQVVKEISEGRSPVKSKGRFFKYSASYRRAIDRGRYSDFNKRKRPVNLKLSGQLLNSIFSRPIGRNKLLLGFDNKLADIHNRQGAGKPKVVRRMLPTKEGETFTDTILFAVGVRLNRLANRIFK